MATYIFDIDGTIADNSHRQWVLEDKTRPQPNWDLFFLLGADDKPFIHMRRLIASMAIIDEDGEAQNIVYCTGRPERYRDLTLAWLEKHSFPRATMYMRADGDRRPDNVVKLELLQTMRRFGINPVMAFDDRDQVVKMWRENGIPCAQVAEGNF